MKYIFSLFCLSIVFLAQAQDSTNVYVKRVLESTEIDILTSYYSQDGDNAAVTAGRGSEELTDFVSTVVVAVPLNDDDILTIDATVSAYTSASSSNVDPFDGGDNADPNNPDPFVASSGASASDEWISGIISYSHSSKDRNNVWGGKISIASEYDYFSLGFGGNYSYLFNEKNTEVSANANVYLDTWNVILPTRFRNGGVPDFVPLDTDKRNSYSLGFGFSQILNKNAQFSLSLDLVLQEGLLSTPFQSVTFSDIDDIIIGTNGFQLGDDIERLPDSRFKTAIGGRFNYYINEQFVVRTYYRFYNDDWGIASHTASIEVPIKLGSYFTVYPGYRFYNQTAADYFNFADQAVSTDEFYTSDYDLSEFTANQFSVGITYTDIFTKLKVFSFGLKSIDIKASTYDRDTTFSSYLISGGLKFVHD